jgi:hypothetical protein
MALHGTPFHTPTRDAVAIQFDDVSRGHVLRIHESKAMALEPDSWWSDQNFAAIAFSTGIAPFLAHIRYMALFEFGRAFNRYLHWLMLCPTSNAVTFAYAAEMKRQVSW